MLIKVDWSEWMTPIAPVMKKNGAEKVCDEFKVNINPMLWMEQYPFLCIEGIFLSVARGKKLSRLDLAQVYVQREVGEGLRKFLTINTKQGCSSSTDWYLEWNLPLQSARGQWTRYSKKSQVVGVT